MVEHFSKSSQARKKTPSWKREDSTATGEMRRKSADHFDSRAGVYSYRGTYRTHVLSHTKLIGHLSSSQQNETDISRQWNHTQPRDGLNCCMNVHSHLSVITHLTNSCLIQEHWRTNQLINQQTNNKPVKPFRKLFTEWLTRRLWISQSFVLYIVGCADIKQERKL